MWGFHDHSLILRTALHRLLTAGVEREGIKRRWKYQTQLRNDEAGGLTFTEEEWEFEWGEILRIATNKPRRQPMTDSLRRHSSLRMSYESLEEIHISVLAHTLRRPIVVISDRTIKDMSGQDLAPIYFGGIYLPVEVNPTACHKSPVVLAYDSSHFSPLVAIQDTKQQPRGKFSRMSSRVETVIPLVSPDGSLLPVQFIYDPKKKNVAEKWSRMQYEVGEFPDDVIRLMESYMNVRWIQLKVSSSDARLSEDYDHVFPVQVPKVRFPAACIAQDSQPIYQKHLIEKYLKHIRVRHQEEKDTRARREAEREEEERKRLLNMIVPCEGEGCDMFGRPATNNLCSVCYEKSLREPEQKSPEPSEPLDSDTPVPEEEVSGTDHHRLIVQHMQGPPDDSHDHGKVHLGEGGVREFPNHAAPPVTHTSEGRAGKRPVHVVPLQPAVQNDAHSPNKQPIYPPKYLPPLPRSLSPDGSTPKSRSPTPPPKPSPSHRSQSPSKGSSPAPPSPAKAATPPSSIGKGPPSKGAPLSPSRGPPPPPYKGTPPPESKAASTKSPTRWVANLVPQKFKKTQSSQPKKPEVGKYSRDKILPLHLEQSASDSTSEAAGTEEGMGGEKRKCKTVNCKFYESPGCAGYCSSCHKVLKDNATVV
jgi:OTU domain-containing protein 7